MKHSPHNRRRGCCGLCKWHKDRALGDPEITPWKVLRKTGKRRRYRRRDLGDDGQ